ncbi:CoxG family protein [Croceicoccus sp. Ery5]|uniref:CoxG family protein n=1 Tax=Croceicoccus sp. Ery5 TaxID=1703340 RepID=UPI001E63737B|nr:carbon monoxide dehydrogenase subunit G [Croceicoccus sp. Ery5]
MELSGSRSIKAPREAVWAALNDPDVLRRSIPGCQTLDPAGENAFNAVVEVRIGPIGASFKSTVRLEDIDAPVRYRIVGEGKGGMAGNASGSAVVELAEEGGGTQLSYRVAAEVGGRLAQLGGAVIDATARRLADQFFARFEQVVTGDVAADAPPAAASGAPAAVTGTAPFPWGWIIALVAVALAAFLAGGGALSGTGDGGVLAAVLLLVFATALGFEFGRRR